MAKKKSRNRRLPPGQRLIHYCLVAGLIVILQASSLPAEWMPGQRAVSTPSVSMEPPFQLSERLIPLEEQLKSESAKPKLRAGLFMVEPATGRYSDLNGRESYAAASMIKVPILVSLLISMDKGAVKAEQKLTVRTELVAGGSGYLQWRPPGSQVSVAEAAELMITQSDNTATNLIIDALGGMDALNRDFRSWGFNQTVINNLLPDFAGTNKTSPYELVYLLSEIDRGNLISEASRLFMFKAMEKTKTKTLLPPGLGVGARIVHKTGDIGALVGDCGIVTTPGGLRYVVAVQVERPHNDRRANELIRKLSRQIYATLVPDAVFPPEPKIKRSKKKIRSHKRARRHH